MKKEALALLFIFGTGFAGCLAPAPKVDPLAGLEAPAAHPSLTVAVGMSENTKKTADYAGRAERMSLGHFTAADMFTEIHSVLKRNFKAVTKVDGPAAAADADLFVLLDAHVKVGQTLFAKSTVDYRLIFMRDGKIIAEARGEGLRKASKDTSFSPSNMFQDGSPRLYQAFALARQDALKQLESSLREQPALRALSSAAPRAVASGTAAPAAPARTFRSDVEEPGFRLPPDESKFAIVVGVEHYSALPAADYAVRDANAVKSHLIALGYPERNVILLANEQAGRAGLAKYLEEWLPRNTDENSKVLFYFSGHGAPDPANGQAYLMPWDGDARFLESTAYPVKKIYDRLNALKAKHVLVAMDACFSGAGGRSVLAKGVRPLVSKIDAGTSVVGRAAALTAAAVDEITGAEEDAGHGLFTYHFLKGIGAASGRATFAELHRYLSPKVRDAARRDNREQTPQLIGAGGATL